MTHRPTTVERAYELAQSGEYPSVAEIKLQLRREGHSDVAGQLYGRSITTDLRRLCEAARGPAPGSSEAGA